MIGPLNWIDLLFLVTIVLLIFNGFRNGAVFSLINLLSIPIAIGVAYFFGKPFALFFANNGLLFSPLISYLVLFFVTILVIQIIGTSMRGVVNDIQATIQTGKQLVPGLNITVQQYQVWHDTYNQAVHNSLFARVNGFFIKELPAVPRLSWR